MTWSCSLGGGRGGIWQFSGSENCLAVFRQCEEMFASPSPAGRTLPVFPARILWGGVGRLPFVLARSYWHVTPCLGVSLAVKCSLYLFIRFDYEITPNHLELSM